MTDDLCKLERVPQQQVLFSQVAVVCMCAQGLQHLVQAKTRILRMFQCLNLHYLSTFLAITETTG